MRMRFGFIARHGCQGPVAGNLVGFGVEMALVIECNFETFRHNCRFSASSARDAWEKPT